MAPIIFNQFPHKKYSSSAWRNQAIRSHRPACKPHSVQRCEPPEWPSFWAACHHAARAAYPGLQPHCWSGETSSLVSLLGLAPFGGCLAIPIAGDAGGLLHHLFTLTGIRRYVSVARSGRLPRPGSYPAKCPVECGLSSTLTSRAATTQPTCG